MNELISMSGIEKSYGGKRVLKNIFLNIEKSSIVGLIGQSGSGKTTLAKILAGLTEADSGKITYDDREIGTVMKRTPVICGDIQYIFQDPYSAVEGSYTVKQVLDEAVSLCRRQKRKYTYEPGEVMEMVGMNYEEWKARKADTLSGGQRQKLCLARAILPKPRLIIADESTAMLNNDTAAEIYRLLEDIRKRDGAAVFIITHQAQIINGICDYLNVLYEGEIVDSGSSKQVLSSPGAGYTKRLLECMDYLGGMELG